MWDYAKLTKAAKRHGGVKNYVNDVYKAGQRSMIPLFILTLLVPLTAITVKEVTNHG